MSITRRDILGAAAGAAAGLFLPRRIWAQSTLSLGAARIDSLSDGHLVLPLSFVGGEGVDPDTLRDLLARSGITGDQVSPPCNVTLLRDAEHTVLFDAGAGSDFMPSAGKLSEALAALDLSHDDITDVVFTHAHPDHLWGILDDFDEVIFPNATLHLGRAEFEYWSDDRTLDTIGAERQSFAVGAKRRLGIIADQLSFFEDGDTVLPGAVARATYGHTPGHMSFMVKNGTDSAMVVGDAIGNDHMAFARPDWASGSDQDAELGATTRLALLNELAESGMRMIGYHLRNGGIGRVEKSADAFHFVNE